MQTVLITGANGFIGYYLAQQLVQKGYKVIATGKGENRLPLQASNFIYASMDFTNAEEVNAVLKAHQPAVVVHCGAISKPDECELNKEMALQANVGGTQNLLEVAKQHKSFFIFLSTDFVFSGKQGMYKEEDERNPVNYYGQTKLLAEENVKQYPFGWAIVRTVLVYGKTYSGRENIVTNTAKALQKGMPLKIFNDQVRTPTYVEDLASGIVAIVERRANGIYHLSGEDTRTPYGIAVAVAEKIGADPTLITPVREDEFDQPARRPLKTGFNITKAKEELGYRPLSFREGLDKTFS